MTRKEEIRQASIEYTYQKQPMCIGGGFFSEIMDEMNRNHAFEDGAKWADEHPNLYNKEKYRTAKVSCLDELTRNAVLYDALIEKSCEWLNNNAKNYTIDGGLAIESLIYSFKKAMEE